MSRFGLGFISAGGGIPGNDAFTKIMIHADGIAGGTTFPDVNAGGSLKTWTAVGSTISSGGKFTTALKGAYITCPVSADMQIGSNDMTADFWLNVSGLSGAFYLMGQSQSGGAAGQFTLAVDTSGRVVLSSALGGTGFSINSTSNLYSKGWTHVAIMKTGPNLVRLTIDGVEEAQTTGAAGSFNTQIANFSIGRDGDFTGSPMSANALIDEFRLSIGVTRWPTNFTPPTAQYI